MATNFVQPGDTLTIIAPEAVTAGAIVAVGDLVGIAAHAAAETAQVDVHTSGVWVLPKVGANTFTLGAKVYWDATAKLATSTAASNVLIGYCVEHVGSGQPTVKARLRG